MSADAHGKTMSGASAHLIASSWTSANTRLRQGYAGQAVSPLALDLTRMPPGATGSIFSARQSAMEIRIVFKAEKNRRIGWQSAIRSRVLDGQT
jgi:hypothetical protein